MSSLGWIYKVVLAGWRNRDECVELTVVCGVKDGYRDSQFGVHSRSQRGMSRCVRAVGFSSYYVRWPKALCGSAHDDAILGKYGNIAARDTHTLSDTRSSTYSST